jgi:hypothetical protein
MTKRNKMLSLIVVLFFIIIFIYGISYELKCKRLLAKKDCICKIVYCTSSKKVLLGNGPAIHTVFFSTEDSLYFGTDILQKPLPLRTPIFVRYSPECPHCKTFLWDSIVQFGNRKVRYYKNKGNYIEYEINNIN